MSRQSTISTNILPAVICLIKLYSIIRKREVPVSEVKKLEEGMKEAERDRKLPRHSKKEKQLIFFRKTKKTNSSFKFNVNFEIT